MPWTDKHLSWLTKTKNTLKTADGQVVEIWELSTKTDPGLLAAWAKHFRNHYCLDTQIDALRNATGLSRSDYLLKIKFPDNAVAPGPSIRAGDFGEILVADFVQYVLKYWVPRTRYADKTVRNESTKGCDILGFKIIKQGKFSKKDELAIFEAKTQFTGTKPQSRLQDAIDDSIKDELRKAESLNAIKQKLLDSGSMDGVGTIERFQNFSDHPYVQRNGAAALFETTVFCQKTLAASSTTQHPNAQNLMLIVIRGKKLMDLVHELYQRAAHEA